ncbi:cell growth-regulating nucleolar protein-like [Xyrauchen texanus]|uniref:cell growth-regulating nucleolar protein-like n=1 Tax=Xyrauchen texanus TaxID=154827 RepID=UPI002241AC1B|nr:cell growth-regulating nucleolar protein-like [Xyrauchen texanus]
MCRGCRVSSCIDCGKVLGLDVCADVLCRCVCVLSVTDVLGFVHMGDNYKNHNKFIRKDQKYGGKDFQVKAIKGDVKQHQWIQRIQEAMNRPGVEYRLRQVLDQVSSYNNVPRKRAKFENWMENSLMIHNLSLVEQDVSQNNHSTLRERDRSTENQTNLNNGAAAELNEENNTSKREKKQTKEF